MGEAKRREDLEKKAAAEGVLAVDFGHACIILWHAVTNHDTKFAIMRFLTEVIPTLPVKTRNAITAAIAAQQLNQNIQSVKAGEVVTPTPQESSLILK